MKFFTSYIVIAVALSAFLQFGCGKKSPPPNIIFIMADDMGYGDLGVYGQTKFQTPRMDALAGEGIRFTQAYAGGPVCTASRSVLMTGLHNGHTPARDNVPHYDTYLEDGHVTLAEVLKGAGYRTGGLGKWSLGDPGTAGDATRQGFDMWFGYQNQDHAHYYFPEYLDDSEAPNGRMELPGNSKTREVYSHDLLAERALKFIRESGVRPFFLYAAFTLPHFSSKAEDPDGLAVPSLDPYTGKPWSPAAQKYGAMMAMLDEDIGRMVDLVDELGLRENTLIIVTSDNGPLGTGPHEELNNNGPLRGSKRDLYEGGIRVPFIARWPGKIPEGKVSDEIVTHWDMLPTFAKLAGAEAPPELDGLSMVQALTGGTPGEKHEYLYWDYGHTRNRYDQAVRLGDWKGIRLGLENAIQLYDLKNDLGETTDVASTHPEVIEKISRILKTAAEPTDRYAIGELYRGNPIWQRHDHW